MVSALLGQNSSILKDSGHLIKIIVFKREGLTFPFFV